MSTSHTAVAQVLHQLLATSGGRWLGGPTALHQALVDTARGPWSR